jgi:ATP/maltotriose-dependent transcriptional regulator MalT
MVTWSRDWPLIDRLQIQLQTMLDHEVYETHWEKGTTLSLESVTTYLQQAFRATLHPDEETPAQLLTARERQILGLLSAGKTNPQIAAELVIGDGTVKTHTLNIYRKLDVANRTQAIIRAQELGLLGS